MVCHRLMQLQCDIYKIKTAPILYKYKQSQTLTAYIIYIISRVMKLFPFSHFFQKGI